MVHGIFISKKKIEGEEKTFCEFHLQSQTEILFLGILFTDNLRRYFIYKNISYHDGEKKCIKNENVDKLVRAFESYTSRNVLIKRCIVL